MMMMGWWVMIGVGMVEIGVIEVVEMVEMVEMGMGVMMMMSMMSMSTMSMMSMSTMITTTMPMTPISSASPMASSPSHLPLASSATTTATTVSPDVTPRRVLADTSRTTSRGIPNSATTRASAARCPAGMTRTRSQFPPFPTGDTRDDPSMIPAGSGLLVDTRRAGTRAAFNWGKNTAS